jgi:NAD-dependent deacetylase
LYNLINQAGEKIIHSGYTVAFSGAGISVASGIPPFRGEGGIWTKYDPQYFEYEYFLNHPDESWMLTRYVFYNPMVDAEPNEAHYALAELQRIGKLNSIITQNIDNLHQKAGCTNVIDFHGNLKYLVCLGCGKKYNSVDYYQSEKAPKCPDCGNYLKPDFIFFGEQIPDKIYLQSIREAQFSDLLLIIGTSGEVMPANLIPYTAKKSNAYVIEINTKPSNFTDNVTDLFLQGEADTILKEIQYLVVNRLSKL